MARGYSLLTQRNRLIPRVEVPGRHRTLLKEDLDDPFENGGLQTQYEDFTAVECVIQPMRGKAERDQNNQLVPEGEKDYDSYTVYSETFLYRAREESTDLSDQLLLKDSRGDLTWFTVMKADVFQSSGTQRYRYHLIAIPAGTEGGL